MTAGERAIEGFVATARAWLDEHAERRSPTRPRDGGGGGDGDGHGRSDEFSVAVFHDLLDDEERELLARLRAWAELKAERGYHAIAAPVEYGGLGLPQEYAQAYAELEEGYVLPASHETYSVTTRLIAPTIMMFGTDEQRRQFVALFLRAAQLCCQLFSEPGAGSDLAGLACRAERDGDEWVINGQKVWSSGARFSEWGELIARSDPNVVKHKGMTAFIIPMDLPGMEIRPIKQMSGGSSFNEVFFNDVRVSDSMRLGEVGDGWRVALTTLGFERDHTGQSNSGRVGGSWRQLVAAARARNVTDEPMIRQQLASAFIHERIETYSNHRLADLRQVGVPPGPEGSLSKLLWTNRMTMFSDVISQILGPSLVADTGEWATYAWGEHVLGAPGYRIAGGSDEIQRNILGEHVLGLPVEPRVDKDIPWRDVPR